MTDQPVAARVRHLIELNAWGPRPAVFEFESRDIGFTQGATIRHDGAVVVHFRPGTRYWDTALESAQELLATAMGRALNSDGSWRMERLVEELATAMKDGHCRPWDGRDPEPEGEW